MLSSTQKKSGRLFTIGESAPLLEALYTLLPEKSRTTVKSYLTHRQVSVNRVITTKYDYALQPGDQVEISSERGRPEFRHPMLRIVYEDDFLIVAEKKYGLLSIATDKEKEKTAFHILSRYVKQADPRNKIFVVHRLDRETSGLILFAKSEQAKEILQTEWNDRIISRRYYAVTEGIFAEETGKILSFLAENKAFKVYTTTEDEGKRAVLEYRVLKTGRNYSLLEIELETGRKNQIRAQLESVNHPIAGDKKYGAQTNPLGRVALHAGTIEFIHPETQEKMAFDSRLPGGFNALFRARSCVRKGKGKDQL